jgi:hypothetical protein
VHRVGCLSCGAVWNQAAAEAKEDNHAS